MFIELINRTYKILWSTTILHNIYMTIKKSANENKLITKTIHTITKQITYYKDNIIYTRYLMSSDRFEEHNEADMNWDPDTPRNNVYNENDAI